MISCFLHADFIKSTDKRGTLETTTHPMIRHLLTLLQLVLVPATFACLNTSATKLDGASTDDSRLHEAYVLRAVMKMPPAKAFSLNELNAPKTPAEKLERQALELIYAGDYSDAVPLLRQAEALQPGGYSIAANLGTAYELTGDNASALSWISEGIRRNPSSHMGTEWIHVLILEAKLNDAKPASQTALYLKLPEVLNQDTPIVINGISRPAKEVRDAISYQLQERMVFVKPQDAYVADLLFTLAQLDLHLASVESANELLDLAVSYGFPASDRVAAMRHQIEDALTLSTIRAILWWTTGLGLTCLALIVGYRRKWFFLTQKAYLEHRAHMKAGTLS